jgi:hypothetical protein
MTGLTAITLFLPGTPLDGIWRINPEGHAALSAGGNAAAAGMAAFCAIMSVTAVGLFKQRRWAWWAAAFVLCANVIGDLTGAIVRHDPKTLIGVPIAGFVVWWLTRPSVRALFH